jgi:hypothetical protein
MIGDSFDVKTGVKYGQLEANIEYEKNTSNYKDFVPSSEKIEVGVIYKGGPKWEVDVIGAKTTENFKDDQSNGIYNAEVKLKIFLW